MATTLGHKGTVKLATTAIGEITAYECNLEADLVEDTACKDTFKTFKRSLPSWGGSFTFWFAPDDEAQQLSILNEFLSGDGEVADLRLEFQEGTANGYISGAATLYGLSMTNPGISGLMTGVCRYQGASTPTWTAST